MSHFAEVINGIVTRVIVVDQDFINTGKLGNPSKWIQTSFNTYGGIHYNNKTGNPSEDQTKSLRKNYAWVGDNYDETRDAFFRPQPFNSWTLNESTCLWESPVPYPADGGRYLWNEEKQIWVKPILNE